MRTKKETLHLECMLTEDELKECGKVMAEAHSKAKRCEDSLVSYKSQAKAEIDSAKAKENLMAEKINSGKEYREIECTIQYDFVSKIKSWIRKDTGEVVKDDIISDFELQEEMNLKQ